MNVTNSDVNKTPSQIGSYIIENIIGRGGMGIVYRARHLYSSQAVALKTVYVPSSDQLEHIRREIHALSKINHPGIVKITAEGMDNGLPWYAMELLDGKTLDEHYLYRQHQKTKTIHPYSNGYGLSDSTARFTMDSPEAAAQTNGTHSKSSERKSIHPTHIKKTLTLIRRLCSPLSFLHGEGFVHRDLKPENILICRDDRPVIFDFGVAAQFTGKESREKLEIGGLAVGTLIYMAPEQIRGEFVDARVDLYSIGCIVYELLCGEPPFVRSNMIDLIRAHLHEAPAPLSSHVDGIPDELDELILHLLEKKPQNRLGYADDLGRILNEMGAANGCYTSAPKARDFLYRPSLAGRQDILSEIKSKLEALAFGHGGIIYIGGETGVGKTRLVMELSRIAQNLNDQVLIGECTSIGPGLTMSEPFTASSLHPLKQILMAIADHCRNMGKQETDRLIGNRGKVLADYEPAFLSLPGQDQYPPPVELPGEAARLRILKYLFEVVQLYVNDKPSVLILDDLQWADGLTLSFLEYLLQGNRLEQTMLLMICTYRTEEAGDALKNLFALSSSNHYLLERLDGTAVRSMVADMLAITNPPDKLIEFLVIQSEGNPFFVAEYIRTAVSSGLLYRDATGRWQISASELQQIALASTRHLSLPQSLRDIISQRLNGLPREVRYFVETAAVLGREINLWLLLQICDLDETEFMEILQNVKTKQIMEGVKPRVWRFVHDKIREVVYGNISPESRRELHRLAAVNIQFMYEQKIHEYYDILGYHWEQSDNFNKARDCYLSGARQAATRHSYRQAEDLYSAFFRLLEHPTHDSERIRCEYAENVLLIRGRIKEATDEFRRASMVAESFGDLTTQGIALHGLACCYRAIGRIDDAWLYCEKSLRIHQKGGNRRQEGLAQATLALIAYDLGNLDKARILSEQALDIHRQVIDRKMEGTTLGRLGFIFADQGYLKKAQMFFELAIQIHKEINNRREEAVVLGNVTQILWAQGKIVETVPLLEEALTIFQEVGDLRGEGMILTNLSNVYIKLHQLDLAEEFYNKALTIHQQGGERGWEAADMMNYACILHEKQHLDEAEKIIRTVIDIDESIGDRYSEGRSAIRLAMILEDKGDVEEARSYYKKSIQLLKNAGDRRYLPQALYHVARLDRWTADEPMESEPNLLQAESIYKQLGNLDMVGVCFCERGHLALALGLSADRFLEKALLIKSRTQESINPLEPAIARLSQTLEAAHSKTPLFRGEMVHLLPNGIKRWIIENNRLLF